MIASPRAPQERASDRFPQPIEIPEDELEHPRLSTIGKLVRNTIALLFHDPTGMILGSAFLLLMLWGFHGGVDVLGVVWKGWTGPGSSADPSRARIIPGIPWDQEWISFGIGAVLLVVIPCVLITRVFKQRLRDYGLGLPRRERWGLTALSALVLAVIGFPGIYLGAHGNTSIRATYPLYRAFTSDAQFWIYELGYFVFFVVIEFIFRGYLLFGLFHAQRARGGEPDARPARRPITFGYYAIFVSMLSYTAWHLGKPVPELWSTLAWGVLAGTIALATETIWHIVIVHWAINVFMDLVIWKGW